MVVVMSAVVIAFFASGLSGLAIAVICVLLGVITGLFKSSSNIMLREIVPKPLFPKALANNQARDAAVELSAAPFAGFLIAIGAIVPFVAIAVLHVGAFFATLRMPAEAGEVSRSGASFLQDLGFGFRYLWKRPHLILSSVIVALANFALTGVIVTLQLSLATAGVAPVAIGLLLTATSLGMILGAILAAKTVHRLRVGMVLPVSLGILTAAFLSMMFLPAAVIFLSVPMVVIGFVLPFSNTGLMSWLYMVVPSQYQGRVHSVGGLLSSGAVAIAPIVAGTLLTHLDMGVSIAVLTVSIMIAGIIAVSSKKIRGIGRPGEWAKAADE